jgi:hypothetical protein
MEPVDILVLRPSEDLGVLASKYEPRLPPAFRYLTRSLGTRETNTSDLLSMMMFQHDYLERLLEIGERDAAARSDEIRRLAAGGPAAEASGSGDRDLGAKEDVLDGVEQLDALAHRPLEGLAPRDQP